MTVSKGTAYLWSGTVSSLNVTGGTAEIDWAKVNKNTTNTSDTAGVKDITVSGGTLAVKSKVSDIAAKTVTVQNGGTLELAADALVGLNGTLTMTVDAGGMVKMGNNWFIDDGTYTAQDQCGFALDSGTVTVELTGTGDALSYTMALDGEATVNAMSMASVTTSGSSSELTLKCTEFEVAKGSTLTVGTSASNTVHPGLTVGEGSVLKNAGTVKLAAGGKLTATDGTVELADKDATLVGVSTAAANYKVVASDELRSMNVLYTPATFTWSLSAEAAASTLTKSATNAISAKVTSITGTGIDKVLEEGSSWSLHGAANTSTGTATVTIKLAPADGYVAKLATGGTDLTQASLANKNESLITDFNIAVTTFNGLDITDGNEAAYEYQSNFNKNVAYSVISDTTGAVTISFAPVAGYTYELTAKYAADTNNKLTLKTPTSKTGSQAYSAGVTGSASTTINEYNTATPVAANDIVKVTVTKESGSVSEVRVYNESDPTKSFAVAPSTVKTGDGEVEYTFTMPGYSAYVDVTFNNTSETKAVTFKDTNSATTKLVESSTDTLYIVTDTESDAGYKASKIPSNANLPVNTMVYAAVKTNTAVVEPSVVLKKGTATADTDVTETDLAEVKDAKVIAALEKVTEIKNAKAALATGEAIVYYEFKLDKVSELTVGDKAADLTITESTASSTSPVWVWIDSNTVPSEVVAGKSVKCTNGGGTLAAVPEGKVVHVKAVPGSSDFKFITSITVSDGEDLKVTPVSAGVEYTFVATGKATMLTLALADKSKGRTIDATAVTGVDITDTVATVEGIYYAPANATKALKITKDTLLAAKEKVYAVVETKPGKKVETWSGTVNGTPSENIYKIITDKTNVKTTDDTIKLVMAATGADNGSTSYDVRVYEIAVPKSDSYKTFAFTSVSTGAAAGTVKTVSGEVAFTVEINGAKYNGSSPTMNSTGVTNVARDTEITVKPDTVSNTIVIGVAGKGTDTTYYNFTKGNNGTYTLDMPDEEELTIKTIAAASAKVTEGQGDDIAKFVTGELYYILPATDEDLYNYGFANNTSANSVKTALDTIGDAAEGTARETAAADYKLVKFASGDSIPANVLVVVLGEAEDYRTASVTYTTASAAADTPPTSAPQLVNAGDNHYLLGFEAIYGKELGENQYAYAFFSAASDTTLTISGVTASYALALPQFTTVSQATAAYTVEYFYDTAAGVKEGAAGGSSSNAIVLKTGGTTPAGSSVRAGSTVTITVTEDAAKKVGVVGDVFAAYWTNGTTIGSNTPSNTLTAASTDLPAPIKLAKTEGTKNGKAVSIYTFEMPNYDVVVDMTLAPYFTVNVNDSASNIAKIEAYRTTGDPKTYTASANAADVKLVAADNRIKTGEYLTVFAAVDAGYKGYAKSGATTNETTLDTNARLLNTLRGINAKATGTTAETYTVDASKSTVGYSTPTAVASDQNAAVTLTAVKDPHAVTVIESTDQGDFTVQIDGVTASTSAVAEGSKVTLNVTPNEGYAVSVSAKKTGSTAEADKVSVTTKTANSVFEFTMPAYAVEVTVTYSAAHAVSFTPVTTAPTASSPINLYGVWTEDGPVTSGSLVADIDTLYIAVQLYNGYSINTNEAGGSAHKRLVALDASKFTSLTAIDLNSLPAGALIGGASATEATSAEVAEIESLAALTDTGSWQVFKYTNSSGKNLVIANDTAGISPVTTAGITVDPAGMDASSEVVVSYGAANAAANPPSKVTLTSASRSDSRMTAATVGATVTVAVTAAEGYVPSVIVYKGTASSGVKETVTAAEPSGSSYSFTFTMPAYAVTVDVDTVLAGPVSAGANNSTDAVVTGAYVLTGSGTTSDPYQAEKLTLGKTPVASGENVYFLVNVTSGKSAEVTATNASANKVSESTTPGYSQIVAALKAAGAEFSDSEVLYSFTAQGKAVTISTTTSTLATSVTVGTSATAAVAGKNAFSVVIDERTDPNPPVGTLNPRVGAPAYPNDVAQIKITPDTGYAVKSVKITDTTGADLTAKAAVQVKTLNSEYLFTVQGGENKVDVTFDTGYAVTDKTASGSALKIVGAYVVAQDGKAYDVLTASKLVVKGADLYIVAETSENYPDAVVKAGISTTPGREPAELSEISDALEESAAKTAVLTAAGKTTGVEVYAVEAVSGAVYVELVPGKSAGALEILNSSAAFTSGSVTVAKTGVTTLENLDSKYLVIEVSGETGSETFTKGSASSTGKVLVILKGDTNLNGEVNVTDAAMTANALSTASGSQSAIETALGSIRYFAADANGSGDVTITDCAMMAATGNQN